MRNVQCELLAIAHAEEIISANPASPYEYENLLAVVVLNSIAVGKES